MNGLNKLEPVLIKNLYLLIILVISPFMIRMGTIFAWSKKGAFISTWNKEWVQHSNGIWLSMRINCCGGYVKKLVSNSKSFSASSSQKFEVPKQASQNNQVYIRNQARPSGSNLHNYTLIFCMRVTVSLILPHYSIYLNYIFSLRSPVPLWWFFFEQPPQKKERHPTLLVFALTSLLFLPPLNPLHALLLGFLQGLFYWHRAS